MEVIGRVQYQIKASELHPINSALVIFTDRRCTIPSTGFYEWKDKQKYHFTLPGSSVLYMAGIYNEFAGEPRFVILTTAANESVEEIHDRMPLVLEKNMLNDWISNNETAMHLIHDAPPQLYCKLE